MTLLSAFFAWRQRLPSRLSPARRHRSIRVPMTDGVTLATDHYEPLAAGAHPTILMRTPYGRNSFAAPARCYAERGFHVVVQACRGTEKSGGEFDPLVNERDDGLATLAWLRRQPWFDGRLGLTGPSYLGYTQWAISDAPEVRAMAVKVSSAEFRSVVFPSGAFHLGLWLSWLQTVETLRHGGSLLALRRALTGGIERRTRKAALTLPLVEADIAAVGRRVWFWRRWFEIALTDGPFWRRLDHRQRLGPGTPPVHLFSGWYDFMVGQLLNDYHRLVAAGARPYLTVSASTHITGGHELDNPADTLAWMRAHLLGDGSGMRRAPVRIEIGGSGEWYELEAFPPGPIVPLTWNLGADGALGPAPAAAGPPDRYRYDPDDPTPNVGGAIFAFTGAGPRDQAPLEQRKDTLTFTSGPLPADLVVVGRVRVVLFARASIPIVDFFVRLSDVDTAGTSINVADGLAHIDNAPPAGPDGTWRLAFGMHPTAYNFRAGHRLRILVASGAYPRYARNLGTDDPIGFASHRVPADIDIFHDPDHPTTVTLPTWTPPEGR